MKNTIGAVIAPFMVSFINRDVPVPQKGEAILRVQCSAVCGSDLHIFRDKHPAVRLPATIGHELSGEVVQLGEDASGFAVGDRVTLEPVIACGQCAACQRGFYGYCENISFSYREGDGAMAHYIKVKTRFLHRLPKSMSYEAGALIEPLAVATHAVRRAGIGLGESVVIIGAGAIGILAAAVCKASGAGTILITDRSDFRLEMARKFGATHTVNATREDPLEMVARLSDGAGFDKSFECVGHQSTFHQAMFALKRNGQMTQVGIFEEPNITINAARFVTHEIRVVGAQGYCWDFPAALSLAEQISLESLITHSFSLEQLQTALETAMDANAVKVVIKPQK